MFSEIPAAAFLHFCRRYYVLQDQDGEVWLFREWMEDGLQPTYTLKGETLNPDILGAIHKAYLYCKFERSDQSNRISVSIKEIYETKQSKSLGSWMLVRLIYLVLQLGRERYFEKLTIDINPHNEQQVRSYLHRQWFIRKLLPSDKEHFVCPVEDLRWSAIPELREMDFREIVKEWHINLAPLFRTPGAIKAERC